MIPIVVDRFTKMAHFSPICKKDSPPVARAYFENVWKYHGFPEDVVSDRDGTFTGQFFTDLYNYLGIKRSVSTAYHPQTDGQTERINQVIESYLRSYCNYEQNDWASIRIQRQRSPLFTLITDSNVEKTGQWKSSLGIPLRSCMVII
jgi:hypothetical protein